MWSETWRDLRLAARTLRGSPMFALTAMLSLAIGIGGTAVIFGVVDAYLIRPWPGIADPERLVEVGRVDMEGPGPSEADGFSTFSYPNYQDYLERQTRLSGPGRQPTPKPSASATARARCAYRAHTCRPTTFRCLAHPWPSGGVSSPRTRSRRSRRPSASSAIVSGARSSAVMPTSSAGRCSSMAVRSPSSASRRPDSTDTTSLRRASGCR